MYPKLFTIPAFDLAGRTLGPFTLHTYGLMLAIAFLAGLWVVGWQARKAGLDPDRITDLGVWVLVAGIVGAKILLLAVEWRHYVQNPWNLWWILQSGGVFYGGLLAAFPVAFYYTRRYGLDPWRSADVLAPGVVLGQAIGRLGCLAAGCCHGTEASVPWAITFRNVDAYREVGVPLDKPLHPTQIYESLACLAIFFLLVRMAPKKKFDGQVTLAYVFLYAIARFVIEFYRGDTIRGFVFSGHLSTSQLIAILMTLAAVLLFPRLRKAKAIAPA